MRTCSLLQIPWNNFWNSESTHSQQVREIIFPCKIAETNNLWGICYQFNDQHLATIVKINQ